MSRPIDVALATAEQLAEPDVDLVPLRDALIAAGIRTSVLAWDDPRDDFSRADMTILRSTWNYPLAPRRFLDWVAATSTVTQLWNRPRVVRWNLHKRYLIDLDEAGIPVVPTAMVEGGSERALSDVAERRGWSTLVVKPAISASSMNTLRVESRDWAQGEAHLRRLAADGDVLVQEYLGSVEDHGERALVWVDGSVTHAVRKSPRFEGDEERTSSAAVPISEVESTLAEAAVETASRILREPLLYARIDVAQEAGGSPVVMELELIEPSLYFAQGVAALERMVAAVASRLGQEREFSF